MRRLYLFATVIFWLLITGLWGVARWLPPEEEGVVITASAVNSVISLEELAKHAVPEDCWMAIRGDVYDLSAYLPEHPTRREVVLPWCGKEASEAYNTKSKGRPHSAAADALLASYRTGALAQDLP